MNLVQFKSNLFGGTWGLNTTEIAVLMFITLQDRARFVFYKNKMMQALNIRDVRTLNRALSSLTAKGIIKQTLASAKGILFSIIGLDKEEPAQEPEPEEQARQNRVFHPALLRVHLAVTEDFQVQEQAQEQVKAVVTAMSETQDREIQMVDPV